MSYTYIYDTQNYGSPLKGLSPFLMPIGIVKHDSLPPELYVIWVSKTLFAFVFIIFLTNPI